MLSFFSKIMHCHFKNCFKNLIPLIEVYKHQSKIMVWDFSGDKGIRTLLREYYKNNITIAINSIDSRELPNNV